MRMPRKISTFCFLLVAIVLVGGLLIWIRGTKDVQKDDFKKCSDQYPFISPELDCGTINEKIEQIGNMDNKIEILINQEVQAGHADQASVFFRDLNTRQWFGVNENVNFYPASLAKLPIAMMFYKTAEVNKKILDVSLSITQEDLDLNAGQHFQPQEFLEAGKSYSVQELIRRMLVYSDNAPANQLLHASDSFRDSVLTDLGIYFPPQTGEANGEWNISAKTYANLFRILFNASYIRPEYSNTILDSLSNSTFKDGLVAGVPEGTKIAHKFGEITHTDDQTKQTTSILNDCGIIYKKNSPYILCIMTQGNDFTNLENIVKSISESVYNFE
jgi:beta-lactamase class A